VRTYWCTARYPVCRLCAVDSHRSSAAATRTVTGNEIRQRRWWMSRSSSRSTPASSDRGTAYSIWWNCTRRREVKTRWDGSTYSRRPSSPVATRFTSGITARTRCPTAQVSPNSPLDTSSSSSRCRQRGSGPGAEPAGTRLFRVTRQSWVCGNH
jgi:hypothetical protein